MKRVNWLPVLAVVAALTAVVVGIVMGNEGRALLQSLVGLAVTLAVLSNIPLAPERRR